MSDQTYERGRSEGFNNAICYVLGYMNGTGNCGSTDYEEILNSAGRDEVIAYARRNGEMRFTGLARYLRRERESARLTTTQPKDAE